MYNILYIYIKYTKRIYFLKKIEINYKYYYKNCFKNYYQYYRLYNGSF